MSLIEGKKLWKLDVDPEFKGLIRPLFKNEYLQLEANLLEDGCREPIATWNNVIIDGHNRYKICTEHGIPFAVEEMEFRCREEVIAWICANQLGRRNLTEETRKYLIGKQYESEKIISRKLAVYQESEEDSEGLPYEPFNPMEHFRNVETKRKTAQRIADENRISHGTVEKYSVYSRAMEKIRDMEPQLASKILSGRYKISHKGVVALANSSEEEVRELNGRLEKSQHPYVKLQTTRQEIQGIPSVVKQNKQPSIKDMPPYDPDAEVVGLTLTIPSWTSSIDRVVRSDIDSVSETAKAKLQEALIKLQDTINAMMSVIKEES